jgi:hypothetical protein
MLQDARVMRIITVSVSPIPRRNARPTKPRAGPIGSAPFSNNAEGTSFRVKAECFPAPDRRLLMPRSRSKETATALML